ncbi:integral membrane protein [Bradyrhizobium sp. USDA 10063]
MHAASLESGKARVSNDCESTQLRWLGILSVLEATTLVLLVAVAVPLKHIAGWNVAVHVMGPVHGLAFLSYCWAAIQAVAEGGWSRAEAARLFATAFIPFAGFANLRFIARKSEALRTGALQ